MLQVSEFAGLTLLDFLCSHAVSKVSTDQEDPEKKESNDSLPSLDLFVLQHEEKPKVGQY